NSILISKLSTQLHLERRGSFKYILNKATSAELLLQYSKTDAALDNLEKNSTDSISSYLQYSMLAKLQNNRKLVFDKQFTPEQTLNYYTSVLDRVHSFYNTSVENTPYLDSISKDLAGQG